MTPITTPTDTDIQADIGRALFGLIDDNTAALTCARAIASGAPVDTAAMKAEIKSLRKSRRNG